jgi:hypothetical protein
VSTPYVPDYLQTKREKPAKSYRSRSEILYKLTAQNFKPEAVDGFCRMLTGWFSAKDLRDAAEDENNHELILNFGSAGVEFLWGIQGKPIKVNDEYIVLIEGWGNRNDRKFAWFEWPFEKMLVPAYVNNMEAINLKVSGYLCDGVNDSTGIREIDIAFKQYKECLSVIEKYEKGGASGLGIQPGAYYSACAVKHILSRCFSDLGLFKKDDGKLSEMVEQIAKKENVLLREKILKLENQISWLITEKSKLSAELRNIFLTGVEPPGRGSEEILSSLMCDSDGFAPLHVVCEFLGVAPYDALLLLRSMEGRKGLRVLRDDGSRALKKIMITADGVDVLDAYAYRQSRKDSQPSSASAA